MASLVNPQPLLPFPSKATEFADLTQYDADLIRALTTYLQDMATRANNSLQKDGTEPVKNFTVATLPTTGFAGAILYASDGRKNGEGAGAGTGVLAFYDGTNWIAVDSGQTVAA